MHLSEEHRQADPAHPHLRTSILRRIAFQSILLTSLTAITLSFCAFLIARGALTQRVYGQLSAVAYEKKELIEQRIRSDRERTALLALQEDIRAFANGSGGGNAYLSGVLSSLQEQGVPALGITVFDGKGTTRARTGTLTDPPDHTVRATELIPLFTDEGWEGYAVYAPIAAGGNLPIGTVAIRYSMREFLTQILVASSIGETGEAIIGMVGDGDVILLNNKYAPEFRSPLNVGTLTDALRTGLPMASALTQREGIASGFDYSGTNSFAAYRYLPSLGWGLVVKIAHREAMRGVTYLASVLATISVLLLIIAAYLAYLLARKLSEPVISLSRRMSVIGPKNWTMKRSVTTGDEVELLERVAVKMARRLKQVYENLESVVEERTRKWKQQYLKDRTILQTIENGVVMVDANGNVTDANPAAMDVLRCDRSACLGGPVEELLDIRVHKARLTESKHPVRVALATKKEVRSAPDTRFSIMRSDSILIPVLLVVKPLLDGKQLIGALIVFEDVTEQRRVDYLKSEFISLASHQLRTPLSTLQWYIELFSDEGQMTEEQKEYVTEMDIATKRMSALIDALLHAARLESGDITPQKNQVDLTSLITELGEELRDMGKQKKIACTIAVSDAKVFVHTDAVLLHVVFKNLFSNAVKYTPEGKNVSVAMKVVGTNVKIVVADTGIGIPKHEQKRLFQRLFRASNVRRLDTDGNGLGLYITKMIIDSLGGEITVESTEGRGTKMVVTLPLVPPKKTTTKKKVGAPNESS